jgi:hypothetical protein
MTTILSVIESFNVDTFGFCTREIIAVRKENNVIMSVKLKDNKVFTKKDVIQDIKSGTIKYVVDGDVPVRVISNKYIRSVPNDIEEDNLGNLPTF